MNAVLTEPVGDGSFVNGERLFDIAQPDVRRPVPWAVDPLLELLKTLSEALDIHDVFPRVAQTAGGLLPHDWMELVVHNQAGDVSLQARSTGEFSDHEGVTVAGYDESRIVGDLRSAELSGGARPSHGAFDHLVAAGYRSFLGVRRPARQQAVRLGFFSKRPQAYTSEHLATARRIAACVAVAVSQGDLARTEHDRATVRTRADQIEARADNRARAVAEALERPGSGVHPVGRSPAWRRVLTRATQVAGTETTVFLRGESGTGKEVLARFIHRASGRSNGPFVAINCAALPEQLLESELFGYERGAFTGAHQPKAGQIELASGGVLFLDEVTEMSMTAQAKLLRFLQEREFRRIGGTRLIKANVRVIAASNRDLREAVNERTFRKDLYYRLQVFDIPIPPLRERTSDIPLLAESFLREMSRVLGRPSVHLTQPAMDRLLAHAWPGNIRELQNALERAAILCEGCAIDAGDLSLDSSAPDVEGGTDLKASARRTIERVLQETDWNKAKAARRLGITRTQLYVRLREYGLDGLSPIKDSQAG